MFGPDLPFGVDEAQRHSMPEAEARTRSQHHNPSSRRLL